MGRIKAWAALAGLVVTALAASWFGGRIAAKTDSKIGAARDYRQARKEIDNADLGLAATDAERIERLRKFASGGPSRSNP